MQAIENIEGIYCDGLISQTGRCVFASLWGRTVDVLALYGGITAEQTTHLALSGELYGVSKYLQKRQTRMPKNSRYGSDLVHLMLCAPTVISHDGNERLLIGREPISDARLWSAVIGLADIGLLPHWQTRVLAMLKEQHRLTELEASCGLYGAAIELEQTRFAESISSLLKSGELQP